MKKCLKEIRVEATNLSKHYSSTSREAGIRILKLLDKAERK